MIQAQTLFGAMKGLARGIAAAGIAMALAGTAYAKTAITGVDVSPLAGGRMLVKVQMDGPVATPASFAVNTPPRVAFDFPGTSNNVGKPNITVNEGALRSITLVEADGRTRMVLNLNRASTYESKVDGNALLVTLTGDAKATNSNSVANVTARFSDTAASASRVSIRDVDFRRGNNGEGKVVVDLSQSNIGIDIRQQGKKLVVDFGKASLPKNLERSLDVSDFSTPVAQVDTFAQGDGTRMVIEPRGLWEYSAYQTENKFIVEVKPIVEDPNKLTQGSSKQYKGDRLSLNFQNVEVRAVLQVIADFTGLNIITSDTVSGNVTLRLKDVPWDQALDIIMQTKGLDMRKNGNVLWIAPREELTVKEKLELEARQQVSELVPTQTETFVLKYMKAKAFFDILKDKSNTVLSKRGSAVVDERTNTMFITDIPDKLEEIRRIVGQIDTPARQVMIEARIVEAQDDFGKQLGARLGFINAGVRHSGGRGTFAHTGATEDFTNLFPASGDPKTVYPVNQSVNLPAGALKGFAAGSFAMQITRNFFGTLQLELSALEATGRGKIISSPRVVTSDNTEATIEQGTEIPFQQATSSGATSVAFRKAVLSLKVTPQITPDEKVFMKIKVTKDARGEIINQSTVTIDTKLVDTQALIENGGTLVLGGIYSQENQEVNTKVPLFGDIPVIGRLFRNDQSSTVRKELLVFVTPRIMKENMIGR